MDIKIIYKDNDVLVVDKPPGMVVFNEKTNKTDTSGVFSPPSNSRETLINLLIKQKPELAEVGEPPRYGIAHRLDKDTSGILLVAKNTKSLIFLQKQFSLSAEALRYKAKSDADMLEKNVEKRYIALVEGNVKNDGKIHTFLARSSRDHRKQTVYQLDEPHPKSAREAITEYRILKRYKDYTLLEVSIKTGRRHQIRCHFSYLQHPIAGDKLYKFKNSKRPGEAGYPEGLTRQFLHAKYLKIQLPSGQTKEFESELPEELKQVLKII